MPVRTNNAPANFTTSKHMALNLAGKQPRPVGNCQAFCPAAFRGRQVALRTGDRSTESGRLNQTRYRAG